MNTEPSFKSMMKSVRTDGTGISNETFREGTGFQKRSAAVDFDRGNSAFYTKNPVSGVDYDAVQDDAEKDIKSNEAFKTRTFYPTSPEAGKEAAIDEGKATSNKNSNADIKEQGGKEEGGKKPKMPEKTTKSAADPLLEAIHQKRYGESFQKRNITLDENRWLIGHDRDDDTISQNGFDDVISNDSNQQSNSAAEAKETKEQGTKEQGGKEEGSKKPKMPEKTTPKKASASDPLLDAYAMMRYGHTFQKAEDCCDGGTSSVTKNPADAQAEEQDDDNKQGQAGVPGGIEPVNPNPVHSD